MATQTQGFFGPSPQETEQQKTQEAQTTAHARNIQMAGLPEGRGIVASFGNLGEAIPRELFGNFSNDPAVKKAQLIEQIKQKMMASGLGPDDPGFLESVMQEFSNHGLMDEAMQVNAKIRERAATQAEADSKIKAEGLAELQQFATIRKDSVAQLIKEYRHLVARSKDKLALEGIENTGTVLGIMKEALTSDQYAIFSQKMARIDYIYNQSAAQAYAKMGYEFRLPPSIIPDPEPDPKGSPLGPYSQRRDSQRAVSEVTKEDPKVEAEDTTPDLTSVEEATAQILREYNAPPRVLTGRGQWEQAPETIQSRKPPMTLEQFMKEASKLNPHKKTTKGRTTGRGQQETFVNPQAQSWLEQMRRAYYQEYAQPALPEALDQTAQTPPPPPPTDDVSVVGDTVSNIWDYGQRRQDALLKPITDPLNVIKGTAEEAWRQGLDRQEALWSGDILPEGPIKDFLTETTIGDVVNKITQSLDTKKEKDQVKEMMEDQSWRDLLLKAMGYVTNPYRENVEDYTNTETNPMDDVTQHLQPPVEIVQPATTATEQPVGTSVLQRIDTSRPISQADLRTLAMEAGFTRSEARIMAAIAMAESSGDVRALNDNPETKDLSYGLWQINMIDKGKYKLGENRRKRYNLRSNGDLYNPAVNIRVAREIYKKQGFRAWGAFKNGSYKKFLRHGARG